MLADPLSPSTEVTLLVCGRFGKLETVEAEPLELSEYNKLESWLAEAGLEWGHLPQAESDRMPIEPQRLVRLLARGAAMALALEAWLSRGMWVLSRNDDAYPRRLRELDRRSPPLLYGAGDASLLSASGHSLAVVGSRDIDARSVEYTQRVGRACGSEGITVTSGGARGVDNQAVGAALERGGGAIAILADGLGRAAVSGENREWLEEGDLVLASPYYPEAGFNVGNAMARNKYIYAMVDAALIVSTSHGSGGTWSGAIEALKRGSPPVFVRTEDGAPDGNFRLLEEGARAFPEPHWEDLMVQLRAGSVAEEPALGAR